MKYRVNLYNDVTHRNKLLGEFKTIFEANYLLDAVLYNPSAMMEPRPDLSVDICDDEDNLINCYEVDFDSPYDGSEFPADPPDDRVIQEEVPERDVEALKQLIERYKLDKLNFRTR